MANKSVKISTSQDKLKSNSTASVTSYLVYMNDGIRICSEACACCWDKPNPESYEDKVEYLGKRCKTGHTSILEHSNFVTLTKISGDLKNTEDDIFDALSSSKYLNVCTEYSQNNDAYYILIGGSYRGYIDLYHRVRRPMDNPILKSLSKVIYQNINSKIFPDLIELEWLNKDSFADIEPDPVSENFGALEDNLYEDEKVRFINIDPVNMIRYIANKIVGENIFYMNDVLRMGTITILFKDMSRTGTHQLVRHRNGITQESQRYVDYSHAAFADPTSFKPDKYDSSKKYVIHFGGTSYEMTSMEAGEAIIGIYNDMLSQGMVKEDARSFLPGNVKCRKLYMTFNYESFMKFLELRCHPAAQAEIRSFALSCRNGVNFDEVLNSEYSNTEDKVDEIITDKEVILKNIIENEPELKEDNKQ